MPGQFQVGVRTPETGLVDVPRPATLRNSLPAGRPYVEDEGTAKEREGWIATTGPSLLGLREKTEGTRARPGAQQPSQRGWRCLVIVAELVWATLRRAAPTGTRRDSDPGRGLPRAPGAPSEAPGLDSAARVGACPSCVGANFWADRSGAEEGSSELRYLKYPSPASPRRHPPG